MKTIALSIASLTLTACVPRATVVPEPQVPVVEAGRWNYPDWH